MTLRFHWQTPTQRTRLPKYADDLWYSSITPQLLMDIQSYLNEAPPSPEPLSIRGLIVPHGGYLFSGQVAASAYQHLNNANFDTVILLGPDMSCTTQPVSTVDTDQWNTPLGDVPVQWDMLNQLMTEIEIQRLPEDNEPALEVQLPFLQVILKQFSLVPLMVNTLNPQACQQLAQAIARVATPNTLLIATSDLSRYHDGKTAHHLDEQTKTAITTWQIDTLLTHVTSNNDPQKSTMSGGGAVATLMYACSNLLSQPTATMLHYATTADVHPIRAEQVIGYAAFAIRDAIR